MFVCVLGGGGGGWGGGRGMVGEFMYLRACVCMYECMHVFMYINACMQMYVCMYVYMDGCASLRLRARVYVFRVCAFVHAYVQVGHAFVCVQFSK